MPFSVPLWLCGSLDGAACLLRLFDLGPAVTQTYGSIEDRLAPGRIRIDSEIPVPLELINASRHCVSQAGFHAARGQDLQGVRVEIIREPAAVCFIVRIRDNKETAAGSRIIST